jgi:hypothetical protein
MWPWLHATPSLPGVLATTSGPASEHSRAGCWSTTPLLWLITPVAPTRWSPVMLLGSPSSWIACNSPTSSPPVLTSVRSALADPQWCRTMEEKALLANMWDLVLQPSVANMVTVKWIFKDKFKANGCLDRYKARWVLRGFTQCLVWNTTRPSAPP